MLVSSCRNKIALKTQSFFDANGIQKFIDSCSIYGNKYVLFAGKNLDSWEEIGIPKNSYSHKLDSLQIINLQKLFGVQNKKICVVLDSSGIFDLYFKDEFNRIQTWQEEDLMNLNIEVMNGFLSLMKNKDSIDSLDFIQKLCSLCQHHTNFQIQYTLYQSLPLCDSIKKMDLACQLWNNSTMQEKKYIQTSCWKYLVI